MFCIRGISVTSNYKTQLTSSLGQTWVSMLNTCNTSLHGPMKQSNLIAWKCLSLVIIQRINQYRRNQHKKMQQPPPYRRDTTQETLPEPRQVYPMPPKKRGSHTSATMYHYSIINKRKFIRALRDRHAHFRNTICTRWNYVHYNRRMVEEQDTSIR